MGVECIHYIARINNAGKTIHYAEPARKTHHPLNFIMYHFGKFEKLPKATVRFVMSVRPSEGKKLDS
jgi:hypothetical protein